MEKKSTSKVVSRNQIPNKYWASRPKVVQTVARLFLRIFGWKVEGLVPELEGNENIIIIAVGQTNISAFNSNFCANSDLPLVMDPYKNNFLWKA